MTGEAVRIYKNNSGAYVAQHKNKIICNTWDREYADSALLYYLSGLTNKTGKKLDGTWD